jgi:hypothetical protein
VTLYDSSVLIDYLSNDADAVAYIERHIDERAVAPPLVLFEVYQGEVFRSGPADFDAVDEALEWVTVIDETPALARSAAELQANLLSAGEPLAARDAFIGGAAAGLGERLAVSDADFDIDGLRDAIDVDFV